MTEYLPFSTQEQANEAAGLEPGNPAMTYVDFANQMAKNSQTQASQEEAIKQAQLLTRQKTAANAAGINPEMKGYLSIGEAVAQLKAAGIDDAQIQAFVESLGNQQYVSQTSLDTVIRKKEAQSKFGTPFIASEDDAQNASMVTKEGDKLVSGQSYYDTGEKDADNNAVYAHGGKEPVDPSIKAGQKQQQADEKSLADLGKELSKVTNPSRGNFISQ